MKDYKIIENRPELSPEEIDQGMKFTQVKAKSLLLKKAPMKIVWLKSIGVLLLATSTIVLYTALNNNNPVESISKNANSNELQLKVLPVRETKKESTSDSTHIENKKAINKVPAIKNGIKEKQVKIYRDTVIIETNTSDIKPVAFFSDSIAKDSIHSNENSASQKSLDNSPKKIKGSVCRIWKTNNYCDLPAEARMVKSFDCDKCTMYEVNCEDLNNDEKIHAVWVTIKVNGRSTITLQNKFQNIKLINSDKKEMKPLYIALSNSDRYLSANSKMKNIRAGFENSIDLILFFVEAKPGDKIIIDHFPVLTISE